MKKATMIAVAISVAVSLMPVAAAESSKEQLNAQVHAINDAAKNKDLMNVAYHTTSVETGVPRDQVEALHKRFSDVGPAGIFISCVLAAETKKDPEYFLKRHGSKGWPAIAEENKVPLEKITVRTERLERALQTDKPRKAKNK